MFKPHEQNMGPSPEDYAHAIVAGQGPMSASEEQARQDLGINIDTIEDEDVIKLIDSLCVVQVNGIRYMRPWAMSLRVMVSKVNACRFLSESEAVTVKLKLRNELKAIKLTMNKSDLAQFGAFVNTVLASYVEPAIDDSVNGQKMLSLKVQSREFKVTTSKPGER